MNARTLAATLTGLRGCRIVRLAACLGGLAERLKAAVLKTAVGLGPTGGSNPSPSAKAPGEVAEWSKAAPC